MYCIAGIGNYITCIIMAVLSVNHLSKNFRNRSLLDHIALECKTGEILGIFGRNGSGKSTLLKILFGTMKADSIRLFIDGASVDADNVIPQQLIAYLPQTSSLPKSLIVRDIVMMYFDDEETQDRILYDPLISRIAVNKAGTLSMGELRYFELLLIGHLPHPFLLLDEPFSMIEPLYRESIREFLHEIKVRKGIIITDHYYNDVFLTADSTLLLHNGRLVTVNTTNDLAGYGYLPA